MSPPALLTLADQASDLERSSRLGVSWANGLLLAGCPQVKRAALTWFCPGLLWSGVLAALEDLEGEFLEFGEQGPEFPGVVE